jgi:hypothetical protein
VATNGFENETKRRGEKEMRRWIHREKLRRENMSRTGEVEM